MAGSRKQIAVSAIPIHYRVARSGDFNARRTRCFIDYAIFFFFFIKLFFDNCQNFGRSVLGANTTRFTDESFSRSRSERMRTLAFDLTGCNHARSPLDRPRTEPERVISFYHEEAR